MEIICDICDKRFNSGESLSQHKKAKHETLREKTKDNKKKIKKYFIIIGLILSITIFGYTFYLRAQRPGQYDELANCLTEKGAVIYGNDYCQYTAKQLNYFGKSKKYLNYFKCSDNEGLCNSKAIDITPTWEINGEMYEQVQSLERLADLSGCNI